MNNEFKQRVLQSGIDGIEQLISDGEEIDASDLHHRLYNEDYFIIGSYDAEELLKTYGIFAAIEEVIEYERNNFGEVTAEMNSEAIANMLAYILGENALSACDSFGGMDGNLTREQLETLKSELEAQL